jgi:hypothetical protein
LRRKFAGRTRRARLHALTSDSHRHRHRHRRRQYSLRIIHERQLPRHSLGTTSVQLVHLRTGSGLLRLIMRRRSRIKSHFGRSLPSLSFSVSLISASDHPAITLSSHTHTSNTSLATPHARITLTLARRSDAMDTTDRISTHGHFTFFLYLTHRWINWTI